MAHCWHKFASLAKSLSGGTLKIHGLWIVSGNHETPSLLTSIIDLLDLLLGSWAKFELSAFQYYIVGFKQQIHGINNFWCFKQQTQNSNHKWWFQKWFCGPLKRATSTSYSNSEEVADGGGMSAGKPAKCWCFSCASSNRISTCFKGCCFGKIWSLQEFNTFLDVILLQQSCQAGWLIIWMIPATCYYFEAFFPTMPRPGEV